MRRLSALLIAPSFLACSPALAQSADASAGKAISLFDALGVKAPGLRGAELEAAVRAAEGQPLGSAANPVRTRGIAGQRAYLSRLRCADGKAPRVNGRGIGPVSPFGGVGDVYTVTCRETDRHAIAMDMYHDHVESRAVPGFIIVAP